MRALYLFASLSLLAGALLLAPFHPKIRRGLRGRWGVKRRLRGKVPPGSLWFHVASSGELEQAIPILDRLRERTPELPLYVSYYSPSAERAVALEGERRRRAGLSLPWSYADYVPFDLPGCAKAYVSALKPRGLVLIHRELWPELVGAALAASVPVYWVNVTLTPQSVKWVAWLRGLITQFSFIGTVDERSRELAHSLTPAGRVELVGDSRIDRILDRKRLAEKRTLPRSPHRIVVLASVWEEDWAALSPWLLPRLAALPDWRLWVVPHEMKESLRERVMADCQRAGLPLDRTETLTSHRYVEGVGKLAELYGQADLVFVGGSFRKKVHNVLEPAAYGRPLFTGPFIQNSIEAQRFQEAGWLLSLQKGEDNASLQTWFREEKRRAAIAEKLIGYFEAHRGASPRYAALLIS